MATSTGSEARRTERFFPGGYSALRFAMCASMRG